MNKLLLTQEDFDCLVCVERVAAKPTLSGVGFNDTGMRVSISGIHVWQYEVWSSMLKRCFSVKFKERFITYKNVTCCDEWLSFGNFLEWCNKEVDYKGKPVKGGVLYSPDTCCFVPKSVNILLLDCGGVRGEWPIGVHFNKHVGKFIALVCIMGKRKHLGVYDTPEEAFAAYKIAKEAQIKIVALQHKDVLKPAVFESLMGWEINIDD